MYLCRSQGPKKRLYVLKIEIDQNSKRGIDLTSCTYEDVELAAEVVSDRAEKALALVRHGDITDGACNGEFDSLPLLEALVQLLLLQGAGVHGRSQRHQLLQHRTPASTPFFNATAKQFVATSCFYLEADQKVIYFYISDPPIHS